MAKFNVIHEANFSFIHSSHNFQKSRNIKIDNHAQTESKNESHLLVESCNNFLEYTPNNKFLKVVEKEEDNFLIDTNQVKKLKKITKTAKLKAYANKNSIIKNESLSLSPPSKINSHSDIHVNIFKDTNLRDEKTGKNNYMPVNTLPATESYSLSQSKYKYDPQINEIETLYETLKQDLIELRP
jgi:hypothetical protein